MPYMHGRRSARTIYLDHASLTPIDKRVLSAMDDFIKKEQRGFYANPSSIYLAGVHTKKLLDQSRLTTAGFFHAHADEIFFTGSGTESNNIAMLGVVEHLAKQGKSYRDMHIVVSAIEHSSVLETARYLAEKGVGLDIIPVQPNGIIDIGVFQKALRKNTVLVSVMTVNNEIGTIQPIQDIVKTVRIFRKNNQNDPSSSYPLIHTDACQAILYTEINLEKMGVDLLVADSHKVYGPRGVGMLYVRRSVQSLLSPVMFGGGQENELRPGTENMPGIIGFAEALVLAAQEREGETERLTVLRDDCIEELSAKIPGLIVYGDRSNRIANNINISIPGIDHEFLLLKLDVRGIACSTKSSCLRDEDESYVIRALYPASDEAKKPASEGKITHQSLRFSLGRSTSKKDLKYLVKMIDECVRF